MIKIKSILNLLDENNLEFEFYGDKNDEIVGFSSFDQYKDNTITWVKQLPNFDVCRVVEFAIIQDDIDHFEIEKLQIKNKLFTKTSKKIFFYIIESFFDDNIINHNLQVNTFISNAVKIGKNVCIGSNCVLNGEIVIGDNVIIGNGTVMEGNIIVGNNTVISHNVTIGSSGFAYTEDENNIKTMIKHFGGVEIGTNVNIGANCVIACGTINNTVIKNGCKIDALCHIAHNDIIEENCTLIAGTILYGSVHICENCYIASGIIKNQCVIGKNSIIGVGTIVIKNVEENSVMVGNPAKFLREVKKI